MAAEQAHRLFGLLLTDFFSGSPIAVEIETNLSSQEQFLDVVLTPEERRQALQALPPEERLARLSAEQIRQYLDRLAAGRPAGPRKPRRKK